MQGIFILMNARERSFLLYRETLIFVQFFVERESLLGLN